MRQCDRDTLASPVALRVDLPTSIVQGDGPPWHFARLGVDDLHQRGVRGAGVRIAVLDTGAHAGGLALQHAQVETLDRDGAPEPSVDYNGHGTSMIAIMVGADTAICPDAAIVSIRVFTAMGSASASALTDGIGHALDRGVDIINISGGQIAVDQDLADAVARATSAGVVVVAATDNDPPYAPLYPAHTPTAISVAASTPDDVLVNPLPESWVNIAAPGVNISTYELDSVIQRSGASEATAVTSAVCALLLGSVPATRRKVVARNLRAILTRTAKPAGNAQGPGQCGILQPQRALRDVMAMVAAPGRSS
jgi:hypothetical protein